MPKNSNILDAPDELRCRAERQAKERQAKERQAKERRPGKISPWTEADAQRLLHELEVHQIELEMQNAELRTARDEAEAALEKYTDLYDFAPVGYFTIAASGTVALVNLTGARMFGVDRSRLLGRVFGSFVSEEQRPVFDVFLRDVFAGQTKQSCDLVLRTKGQPPRAVNIEAQRAPNGKECRAAVVDITARKRAEEILLQNEALFSSLIEQAPVGVYVVDSELRMQQVNPKAWPVFSKIRPLHGRDFSEIIDIIWPETIAGEIMDRFRHTLKTGKPYYSTDFSGRRRDTGVREHYEWQLQRITLPAGHHGVVCFFTDITERKRAEEAQRRMDVLAASNQKLEREIVRRQAVEKSLKKSEQHQSRLLERSSHMQEQLRHLSHQILQAQEEERRRISRELHDEIAQTLTGINVRLAGLKAGSGVNAKGLQKKITSTQRLVEESVKIVHRFALELRPSVLDDLGLIPALHSFVKAFAKRTGLPIRLKVFADVEKLPAGKRTVLYRVATESLTNVARHAHATQVEICIEKTAQSVRMLIKDDGKSFSVDRMDANKSNGLGLLGMRERVEMVGGVFAIASSPGDGTTIEAQIPLHNVRWKSSPNHSTRTRLRAIMKQEPIKSRHTNNNSNVKRR